MELTVKINVEIPALDRLCAVLEARPGTMCLGAEMAQGLAQGLAQEKAEPKPEPKAEPVPEPKAEPEPVPEPVPEPAPEPEPKPAVTLGAVQRAAAALRDAGRLADVKALFPEFGIRKLSDLQGAQLDAFADRLREMGVKL